MSPSRFHDSVGATAGLSLVHSLRRIAMNQPVASLGLTPTEIHHLMQQLMLAGNTPSGELEPALSPPNQQTQRLALEAAAALIAANNRRLTEQLQALGLLGDAARPAQSAATPGERLAHD
jgi:hypothetical protein